MGDQDYRNARGATAVSWRVRFRFPWNVMRRASPQDTEVV
jgi:hypothetical protein